MRLRPVIYRTLTNVVFFFSEPKMTPKIEVYLENDIHADRNEFH
jgi:hypothetical protein